MNESIIYIYEKQIFGANVDVKIIHLTKILFVSTILYLNIHL